MPILVDFSQAVIVRSMAFLGKNPNTAPDRDFIRFMVMDVLRNNNLQFKKQFGELVLCFDSKNGYWRKDVFPYYKGRRGKNRAESKYDWKLIFDSMNEVKEEIKTIFPYKMIDVDKAEGDDGVAVIARHEGEKMNGDLILGDVKGVVIISRDKDFNCLQQYPNVKQYDMINRKFIECKNPKDTLEEHVLRGDADDDVPNVLSDDDVFMCDDKRQKPLTASRMEKVKAGIYEDADIPKRIERNRQLIDFHYIPNDIQKAILEQYHAPIDKMRRNKTAILNYMVKHRMRELLDCIGEF